MCGGGGHHEAGGHDEAGGHHEAGGQNEAWRSIMAITMTGTCLPQGGYNKEVLK